MKVFTAKAPGLKDIFEASKDPNISVSRTPFGAEYGATQVYLKSAVPWKGVKGIENVKKVNARVGEAIEKLAEASKALSGINGTVVVSWKGKLTVMPKKAYLMAKIAGKPIEVVREVPVTSKPTTTAEEFLRRAREGIRALTH